MTALLTVLGVVQGVGFRPFTARLAQEFHLTGYVKNCGGIVQILVSGDQKAIDSFVHRLKLNPPNGAKITSLQVMPAADQNYSDFSIVKSGDFDEETPVFPPDLPLCDDCLQEMYDKTNRRYRYPFISCVACGPRYSILERLPYDRENITMDDFPMCKSCAAEYQAENDRRRHAQTISCRDCGPQLILTEPDSTVRMKDAALMRGIELLNEEKVIAVKGIGGYQFACLSKSSRAVSALRRLKKREQKPFAVMFSDLDSVRKYLPVSKEEGALLCSAARPIVLLRDKQRSFCPELYGESRFLGAFLAYTPLHRLLTDACGPLVMTSGNLTTESILIRDEDVLALRSPELSGVLWNKRRIVTPLDDSVARVVEKVPQLFRRSRGYVPTPLFLKDPAKTPILSLGSDLKACFSLTQGNKVYMSPYFGDMDSRSVFFSYREQLDRMIRIFGIHPKVIVTDFHPSYQTALLGRQLAQKNDLPLLKIQHHHAHAASVMAEHNLSSCIAVVMDGTGYGTDGAVWGGEFLYCNGAQMERRGHLAYLPFCGGDLAAKDAVLASYSYLKNAGLSLSKERFAVVDKAIAQNVNCVPYSGMGRLFDAVAALLKLKTRNSYEGECAAALENSAAYWEEEGKAPTSLVFPISLQKEMWIADHASLIRMLEEERRKGVPAGALALGFHYAVADMVLAVCQKIRAETGEASVALSGGVFANLLLTKRCADLLEQDGFHVYQNSAVPMNDGGLSLGQAYLASLLA